MNSLRVNDSFPQEPLGQAELLRAALRCGRVGCACQHGSNVHCPVHADETPSLSIAERDGKILVHCHAGCSQQDVLGALRQRRLWPGPRESTGLTLEALADAKRLPKEFLRGLGIYNARLRTGHAVAIPYYGPNGEEVAVRFRIALHGDRFRWREGARVAAYGVWKINEFKDRYGWVLLVEGESDCWTAWYHELPAIGLPGKSTWRAEWARLLDGFEVLLWQEPGAEDLVARVARDLPAARVIVAPPGIKDISEAHLRGEDVRSLVERLRAAARPAAEIAREVADAELRRLLEQARPVLQHPDPLQLFTESVRRMGYAGDLRPAIVTYLAATTRLLQLRPGQMPAHTCLVGPSSAGKPLEVLLPEWYGLGNNTIGVVLRLRVLSVATVAQMLGLTRAMIRKAIRKGTLRAINIAAPGERPIYVVEPEEVERYRKEHLGRVGRRKTRR